MFAFIVLFMGIVKKDQSFVGEVQWMLGSKLQKEKGVQSDYKLL